MKNVTLSLLAAAAIDAISIGSVSAMPVNNLAGLGENHFQDVRLVCDRFGRCYNTRRAYRPYYAHTAIHLAGCMSRGLGEFQRAILQHKFQGRATVRAIARYMTENSRNPTKTEIGQVRRACRALVAAGYFESIATVDGEAF